MESELMRNEDDRSGLLRYIETIERKRMAEIKIYNHTQHNLQNEIPELKQLISIITSAVPPSSSALKSINPLVSQEKENNINSNSSSNNNNEDEKIPDASIDLTTTKTSKTKNMQR